MKTLVLKGVYKGKILEVNQWCNDWFSLESADGKSVILSPASLAFTQYDYEKIKHSKNGKLFILFEPMFLVKQIKKYEQYLITFKKRKLNDPRFTYI